MTADTRDAAVGGESAAARSADDAAIMPKERMAAFSDGVIAIIITIMVLELKVPHGADWATLAKLAPIFLSYVLSFTYLAIYWVNHHHLLHTCERVTGAILWANVHLMFWLSLVPFTTGWMSENHFAPLPVAVYGFSLLMPAFAYTFLQIAIMRAHGPGSVLSSAVGSDTKGKASIVIYVIGIALAFQWTWVSIALYVLVALIWFVPDRRIERAMRG